MFENNDNLSILILFILLYYLLFIYYCGPDEIMKGWSEWREMMREEWNIPGFVPPPRLPNTPLKIPESASGFCMKLCALR